MIAEIGKKLQFKPTTILLLLNAPEQIANTLMAEGYNLTHTDETPHLGSYDAVQLFVRNTAELAHFAPQILPLLKPSALLWIAYPKKSSGIKSDLSRDEGWKTMTELGYEVARLVSLDETWSSVRFKHMSEKSKSSMYGVDLPGIDRVAKTVEVPADLKSALEEAGVWEAFNKMAFTHRKEHVVAVLEAKRPETRIKRVSKTVEALKMKL